MFILTGDTHGEFQRIYSFCKRIETTTEDIMCILGDAGFNYYLDKSDEELKKKANQAPTTWFCVKGNHEKYAGSLSSYKERLFFGGTVYYEPEYPNILFAKDGEIYTFIINGEKQNVLVIGGAYSIDKYYRLHNRLKWFEDEQPSESTKAFIETKILEIQGKVDFVLSHTCPFRYMPREWFLPGFEQIEVDNTTEKWLDNIYDILDFKLWYCGHFHGNKFDNKIRFLFDDYLILGL